MFEKPIVRRTRALWFLKRCSSFLQELLILEELEASTIASETRVFKGGRPRLSTEEKMINGFIKNMMQLNHKLSEDDARVLATEMVRNMQGVGK